MPFELAEPSSVWRHKTTGVSVSLRGKGGRIVRITMNAEFQVKHFGEASIGKNFSVLHGTGEDSGKLRIEIDKSGTVELRSALKGSGSLSIAAWDGLPRKPVKACPASIVTSGRGAVTIELPDFANEPEAKGMGMKKLPQSADPATKAKPFNAKTDMPKRSIFD